MECCEAPFTLLLHLHIWLRPPTVGGSLCLYVSTLTVVGYVPSHLWRMGYLWHFGKSVGLPGIEWEPPPICGRWQHWHHSRDDDQWPARMRAQPALLSTAFSFLTFICYYILMTMTCCNILINFALWQRDHPLCTMNKF